MIGTIRLIPSSFERVASAGSLKPVGEGKIMTELFAGNLEVQYGQAYIELVS